MKFLKITEGFMKNLMLAVIFGNIIMILAIVGYVVVVSAGSVTPTLELHEDTTSDYFFERGYNVTRYEFLPNGTLELKANTMNFSGGGSNSTSDSTSDEELVL